VEGLMNKSSFNRLFCGFFFILLNFRINGIDILPDIVGYIFFFLALRDLEIENSFFLKAKNFSMPLILLSLFNIYERPAQSNGVNFGTFGGFGILIGIASLILNLILVYNIFMGIKELAYSKQLSEIATEAQSRWNQYLTLQIAVFAAFLLIFIPFIAFIFIIGLAIGAIVLTISILTFMKKCERYF